MFYFHNVFHTFTARRDTNLQKRGKKKRLCLLFFFIQYYFWCLFLFSFCLLYFLGVFFTIICFAGTNDRKNDFIFKWAWVFWWNHNYCCCSLYPGKLLLALFCLLHYSNVVFFFVQFPLLYIPIHSFPFCFAVYLVFHSGSTKGTGWSQIEICCCWGIITTFAGFLSWSLSQFVLL